MRELLDFLVKNLKWFVFVFYVVVSCVLLFSGNPYQHHVYLTSANTVSAGIYSVSNRFYSYFNLKEINDGLNERNAELQTRVLDLEQRLQDIQDRMDSDTLITTESSQYEFVVAHVINNSISRTCNYLTINKGSADGIRPEMGVIDQTGVVGSVNVVAEHSARVISVRNPNFHVSCKIKGSEHFGSLSWDGNDPRIAILEDLPQHSQVKAGDTIVTTGFSSVFPPDMNVGYVLPPEKGKKLSFNSVKVRLATDFTTLSTVQVVVNSLRTEVQALEATDSNQ